MDDKDIKVYTAGVNSVGVGIVVLEAAKLAAEGKSMGEISKKVEKDIEENIEKNVTAWVTAAVTVLVNVLVSFVVAVVILKFVWAWVVPDIFPGAVEEELVVGELTWLTTVKLAILVAVLSGIYHALSEAFKSKN